MKAPSSRLLAAGLIGLMFVPSIVFARGSDSNNNLTSSTSNESTQSPSGSGKNSSEATGTRAAKNVDVAQAQTPPKHEKIEHSAFCSRLDVATNVQSETHQRLDKLSDQFKRHAEELETERQGVATKLAAARSAADTRRQARFSELEAKAPSGSKHEAVLAFEATVREAVITRRAAVDAANDTFRKGVADALSARQNALKGAATTYNAAVSTATAQAKASCTAGVAPETVRNTYQDALKTARTNLQSSRTNVDKVGPSIDALQTARKAAIDQADKSFKATIMAVVTKLKIALERDRTVSPTSSPAPSTTPVASPSASPSVTSTSR